jgi:hypothetical protein
MSRIQLAAGVPVALALPLEILEAAPRRSAPVRARGPAAADAHDAVFGGVGSWTLSSVPEVIARVQQRDAASPGCSEC